MLKTLSYTLAALTLLFAAIFALAPSQADASYEIGQTAPDFEAIDTNGNTVKLSELKGKTVILEWTNHQCPFVVKHYSTNNMQDTQKAAAAHENVEWISIVSSAPGKQGHVNAEKANAITTEKGATISAKILDESGEIGKLYDARTTPHMYIINPEGELVYAGAIDDNSSPNPKTVEGAKNYVLAALDDLKAGNAVTTAQTQPYGCSVKY